MEACLPFPASVMYVPNGPPSCSVPLPDNNPPGFTSHTWVFPAMVGPMTKPQVVELIKQGKAYINLHTAAYPNGEIRGNFTLANGSKTFSPPPPPPACTDDSNPDAGPLRFLAQASYGPSIPDLTAFKHLPPPSRAGERPAVPRARRPFHNRILDVLWLARHTRVLCLRSHYPRLARATSRGDRPG